MKTHDVTSTAPRLVVVTRETEYDLLLARHGTRAQAAFFLGTRNQSLEEVLARHDRFHRALHEVSACIPSDWRRSRVTRRDLSRFLFEPGDIVVVVGRDGLVANVAKYLHGQPVIGINPDPLENVGVLVPFPPEALRDLLGPTVSGSAQTESRTMVEARLGDGQRLLALNEAFIGSRSHQSARYRLTASGVEERQSSSGLIVSTGTGATGWALSVHRERGSAITLPTPEEARLAFFVREAFPSVASAADLTEGCLSHGEPLLVTSEMNEGGVVFGDGIEEDALVFDWGTTAELRIADQRLCLVVG